MCVFFKSSSVILTRTSLELPAHTQGVSQMPEETWQYAKAPLPDEVEEKDKMDGGKGEEEKAKTVEGWL